MRDSGNSGSLLLFGVLLLWTFTKAQRKTNHNYTQPRQ